MKHEIIHRAGQPIPPDLRARLASYFANGELERLERLGGRILLSITAPYNSRGPESTRRRGIDDEFVEHVHRIKDQGAALREALEGLSVKQLRELADRLRHPVRSKATRTELEAELLRSLQAEDYWRRISGASARHG